MTRGGGHPNGGKPVGDVTETIQHERTFRGLLERRRNEITLETILELHGEVFRGVLKDAGQWRRVNVRIMGARFSPPRYEKLMMELETWLRRYRDIRKAHNDSKEFTRSATATAVSVDYYLTCISCAGTGPLCT